MGKKGKKQTKEHEQRTHGHRQFGGGIGCWGVGAGESNEGKKAGQL